MSSVPTNFNHIINKYIIGGNKYVMSGIGLLALMKLPNILPPYPTFVGKLTDNIIGDIAFMFLVLVIIQKLTPMEALIISLVLGISFYLIRKFMNVGNVVFNEKEGMSSIDDTTTPPTIPEFSVNGCDSKYVDIVPPSAEGTISGISENEMQSLCMHLKKVDINSPKEIINPPDFSEIISPNSACSYAKHQFITKKTDVPCAEKVDGNDQIFPTYGEAK